MTKKLAMTARRAVRNLVLLAAVAVAIGAFGAFGEASSSISDLGRKDL